jgi:hypothetical protein
VDPGPGAHGHDGPVLDPGPLRELGYGLIIEVHRPITSPGAGTTTTRPRVAYADHVGKEGLSKRSTKLPIIDVAALGCPPLLRQHFFYYPEAEGKPRRSERS